MAIFRRQIQRRNNVAVLAGAGVSMGFPTALPSGNELRDTCIRALLEDSISRDHLKDMMRRHSYRALLPEVALQEIAATLSKELDDLMCRLLRGVPPNTLHQELARRFGRIFTTNFDLCFEASGAKSVIHLHGKITAPNTIENRSFRLGNANSAEGKLFRESVRGCPLLVLGYSFRDEDIVELVRDGRPSEIYFLSYDGHIPESLYLLKIRSVVARGTAERLLCCSQNHTARKAINSSAIVTRTVLSKRANALIRLCFRLARYDTAEALAYQYNSKLRGRPRCKLTAEVANIQRLAGRYQEAVDSAERLLRTPLCQKPANSDVRSSAHVILGLCELDQRSNQFRTIEKHFRAALLATEEFARTQAARTWHTEILIWRARQYNNFGMLYSEWGKSTKAILYYQRALKIKERFHEEPGIAQTCVNLASLLLQTNKIHPACEHLERVVLLMKKSPDSYIMMDCLTKISAALKRTTHPPSNSQLKRLEKSLRELKRGWRSVN